MTNTVSTKSSAHEIEQSINPLGFFYNTRNQKIRHLTDLDKFAELGKLSSGLLHDILNPMSGIILGLQSLSTKKKVVDEKLYLEQISKSSRKMEQFLSLLQTYLTEETVTKDFLVQDTINNVIDLMNFKAVKSGLNISYRYNARIKLKGNSVKLYQVAINLISNAIDSYSNIPNAADKKVIVSTIKREGFCILSVEDFGCGMSNEVMSKIFKPFYTTKNEKGIGVGLSTVKHIVEEEFFGKIKVQSIQDLGTKFSVAIPLDPEKFILGDESYLLHF